MAGLHRTNRDIVKLHVYDDVNLKCSKHTVIEWIVVRILKVKLNVCSFYT